MKILKTLFVFVLVVAVMAACSGGKGSGRSSSGSGEGGAGAEGGSTAAETVPAQMSVVSTKDGVSSNVSALRIGLLGAADSDYNTDEVWTFVEERSGEAFSTINEILCLIQQSGYEAMIGLGDYNSDIDITQCEPADDAETASAESSDSTSGAGLPEYETWTFNSFRADDSSPHVVSGWNPFFSMDDGLDPMLLKIKLVITEGTSDSNPFGIFQLDFMAEFQDGSSDGESAAGMSAMGALAFQTAADNDGVLRGFLRTEAQGDGSILLQFYVHAGMDDWDFTSQIAKTEAADGSSGQGSILETEDFGGEGHSASFDIAFNADLFLRQDGEGTQVCLDRNNFDTTVHRYNLYDGNGTRIYRESGFSVVTTIDGVKYYGWVGHWGLGFPPEVSIENGATLTREEYTPDGEVTGDDYTAFIAGGRLLRHTRNTAPLGDFAGIPLDSYICPDGPDSCNNYRMEWNTTEQKFFATQYLNQTTYNWTDMTATEVAFSATDYTFGFYSQALGGSANINLKNPSTGASVAITNESEVVFYKEETVRIDDDAIPTALACFFQCPQASVIDGDPMLEETYYERSRYGYTGEDSYANLANQTSPAALVEGTHYVSYTMDTDTMMLMDGSAAVDTSSASSTLSGGGVWSGPMITASEFAKLPCDWDPAVACPWNIYEHVEVYYSWDTGENSWNQLTMLQAADGSYMAFDAPLWVLYENAAGSKFYLDYNGVGSLWGIPGMCVDMDTGVEANCDYDNMAIRWVPQFSIADESILTDVVSGAVYYSKGIDIEQRMLAADMADCTAAELSIESLTLPTGDQWSEPDIGDQPVVEGSAVVDGVVQE